ncbi:MAG: hypothetical protein H8Z69_03840 [Nanohaloarchaea archaeon]|nr:hypothetical protein [Candidatus Nanohaloarchaea archaeon]
MPGYTSVLAGASLLGAGLLAVRRRSGDEEYETRDLEPAELGLSDYEDYLVSKERVETPEVSEVMDTLDSLHTEESYVERLLEPEYE